MIKMDSLEEIKKNLETNQLIIGAEATLKNLKIGKLEKVYVTSNCSADVKEDIEHYTGIAGVEVVGLEQSNEELGVVCKKPFSISVIGLLKVQ